MNTLLTKSRDAGADVAPYRFVKPGGSDYAVVQAAAASDSIVGISDSLGGSSGGRVDVHKIGIGQIELGGSVTAGDLLTSDADGKGVIAATGNRFGAVAEVDGVAGDIIDAMVSLGVA